MVEEDNGSSKLIAGLCYLPLLCINLIAIGYVLLGKNGDKYAKFHALQGLCLFAVWFFIGMALFVLIWIPQSMDKMATFQQKLVDAQGAQNTTAITSAMSEYYSGMLPAFAISFIPMLLFLLLAFLVAIGKDIQIPVLKEFVYRFV